MDLERYIDDQRALYHLQVYGLTAQTYLDKREREWNYPPMVPAAEPPDEPSPLKLPW